MPRGNPPPSAIDVPRYEPNPKHKTGFSTAGPPRRLHGASVCPSQLCETDAAALLADAYARAFFDERSAGGVPKHIYAFLDGVFYAAHNHQAGHLVYHGHPAEPVEVPGVVKRAMRDAGILLLGDTVS